MAFGIWLGGTCMEGEISVNLLEGVRQECGCRSIPAAALEMRIN